MFIDKKTTNKIAYLARIQLTENEVDEFSKDLSKIIGWVSELNKVNVEDTYPLTSVIDMKLYERLDEYNSSNTEEGLLSNAPDLRKNYFAVPKVIE